MAITQQIARISPNILQLCSTDEKELDRLISFQLQSEAEYLDLNWAPGGLVEYFKASNQFPESKLALYLALNGSSLVNYEHRIGPKNNPVYSDITTLSLSEVVFVADKLSKVDLASFLGWLPEDKEEAIKTFGKELTVHPNIYYGNYLKELIAFYQRASKAQMVTVMWWD